MSPANAVHFNSSTAHFSVCLFASDAFVKRKNLTSVTTCISCLHNGRCQRADGILICDNDTFAAAFIFARIWIRKMRANIKFHAELRSTECNNKFNNHEIPSNSSVETECILFCRIFMNSCTENTHTRAPSYTRRRTNCTSSTFHHRHSHIVFGTQIHVHY